MQLLMVRIFIAIFSHLTQVCMDPSWFGTLLPIYVLPQTFFITWHYPLWWNIQFCLVNISANNQIRSYFFKLLLPYVWLGRRKGRNEQRTVKLAYFAILKKWWVGKIFFCFFLLALFCCWITNYKWETAGKNCNKNCFLLWSFLFH